MMVCKNQSWKVVYKNGQPFFDTGKEELPVVMYNSGRISSDTEEGQARLKRYRQAGFRFYVLAALLEEEEIWQPDGSSKLEKFQKRLEGFFQALPDCYLLIFIDLRPPRWWKEKYPEEMIQYASGAVPDMEADDLFNIMMPSYASLPYRRNCGNQVGNVVRFLEQSRYASSILAYHCNWGVYSEWHGFGMMKDMPDVGPAMTVAFRHFLQQKYLSDEALQRAWQRKDARMATAQVPGASLRTSRCLGTLRSPQQEQEVIDGMLCYQQELQSCQDFFNHLIQRECGGRKLIGNYSGYFFGAGYPMEGLHLYTPDVIQGSLVSYQVSPYCYRHRRTGQNGFSRSVLESYASNGKLLIFESDTRTHDAPEAARFSHSETEDLCLLTRDFVQALLRGAGIWYYDFLYGWYDKPYILDLFAKMHQIAKAGYDVRRSSRVAYVCDFKSLLVMAPGAGQSDLSGYLSNGLAEELSHCGISFDTILLEDILNGNAREYDTYIFGNLFRNDSAISDKVQEMRRKGKGLLWMYAPGVVQENEASVENIRQLSGFEVELRDLTEQMPAPCLGSETELPEEFKGLPKLSFTSWEYSNFQVKKGSHSQQNIVCFGNGCGAVALRLQGKGQELFSAMPQIPRELLERFFQMRRIHQYIPMGDDVVYASRQLIAIHSCNGGSKKVSLPEKAKRIHQLLPENKEIPLQEPTSFSVTLDPLTTALFALE